jgi:hypothetical protein
MPAPVGRLQSSGGGGGGVAADLLLSHTAAAQEREQEACCTAAERVQEIYTAGEPACKQMLMYFTDCLLYNSLCCLIMCINSILRMGPYLSRVYVHLQWQKIHHTQRMREWM